MVQEVPTRLYSTLVNKIGQDFLDIQSEWKKTGLAAFWSILVAFFQNVMAANIIENFNIFEIFLLLQGGKKKILDFIEIEKTFVNKKGATF